MKEDLKEEIKELIQKIEDFKSNFSDLNEKREGFSIVSKHINKSIQESEESTKKIIENITYALSLLEENKALLNGHIYSMEIQRLRENEETISSNLTETLTLLEFQDILAQRLKKISEFLSDVEKDILKLALELGIKESDSKEKSEELRKKLEELEWKKEVNQDDVDEILNEFGI